MSAPLNRDGVEEERSRLLESGPVWRAELRRLASEATPGPWRAVSVTDRNDRWSVAQKGVPLSLVDTLLVGGRTRHEPDAFYIAAANPLTILLLLDELDRGLDVARLTEAIKIAQPLHTPSGPPFPERVATAYAALDPAPSKNVEVSR